MLPGPSGNPALLVQCLRVTSVARAVTGACVCPKAVTCCRLHAKPSGGPHGAGVLVPCLSGGDTMHFCSAPGTVLRLEWGGSGGQTSHLGREGSHLGVGQRLRDDREPDRESGDGVHLQP